MTDFIFNKDQYTTAKSAISEKMKHGSLSASDMIFYNALRNKPLESGFTPRTNPGRLNAIGNDPMACYKSAYRDLAWIIRTYQKCLGIDISPEQAAKIFPTWR